MSEQLTTMNPVADKAQREAGAAIENYIAELEKRIARARTFEPEQALAVEFLKAFEHVEARPGGEFAAESWSWPSAKMRAQLSLDPNTVNALMINFDAKSLGEVTEPLRWLASRLGAYTIDDYPELQRRSYVFANGWRTVRFQVFFRDDSAAVCRFVQIGTKQEPVFKLMCGAEEAAQS